MRHLVVITLVVALFFSTATVLGSHAASGPHGCAPATPPPVAGTLQTAPAAAGAVFLNETLTHPLTPWNCANAGSGFADRDAWVELYNPQNQPLDLYGARAYLDTGPNSTIYYFPLGAAIAAHSFLVLFPSTAAPFFPVAPFTLRLFFADTAIDQVTVPPLAGDQSYARATDGGSTWQYADTPTIDASNTSNAPAPQPTQGASPTAASRGSTGTSRGSTASSSTGSPAPLVNGVQPGWSALNLPVTAASTAGSANSDTTAPALQPATVPPAGARDLPRGILIGALTLALLAALAWCWRSLRPARIPAPATQLEVEARQDE